MSEKSLHEIINASLVPIIVGITGHVSLNTDDDTEIMNVFKELQDRYRNTPIVVLSPLAVGADRMVAKAALKARQDGANVSLVCPLPMPIGEYETDFNEAQLEEFRKLLKPENCAAFFELPLLEGSTKKNITDREGEPRKRQYESVGKYIARYSHILLALWDGVDHPELIGGTSQIVKMRHNGDLRPQRILHEMDSGPIFHFLVKRPKGGIASIGPRREVFPGMHLDPAKNTKDDAEISKKKSENFGRVFDGVNSFNIDVDALKNHEEKIAASQASLIPDDKLNHLGEVEQKLLRDFAVADGLAINFQTKFKFALRGLFCVALIALAFFEVYAHIFTHPVILLGYPLVFGYGLYWFFRAKNNGYQKKYLDYRALAEGLRVQFFWVVSGTNREVIDHYLLQQETELDWIKVAIQSYNTPLTGKGFHEREVIKKRRDEETLNISETIIRTRWVTDQRDYFKRKADDFSKNLESNHFKTRMFIIAGVVIAIILFIGELAIRPYYPEAEHVPHWFIEVRHIAVIAIAMALAIAASIHGYTEKTAISAIAKRYSAMANIFANADAELDKRLLSRDVVKVQELAYRLGREALMENGEWLITRRDRELELPA